MIDSSNEVGRAESVIIITTCIIMTDERIRKSKKSIDIWAGMIEWCVLFH
jgi:hypothetical protein